MNNYVVINETVTTSLLLRVVVATNVLFTTDVFIRRGSACYSTKIPSLDMTAIILLTIQTINCYVKVTNYR